MRSYMTTAAGRRPTRQPTRKFNTCKPLQYMFAEFMLQAKFMLRASTVPGTPFTYPSGTRSYTTTLRLGAATSIEKARLLKLLSGTPAAW